MTPDNTLPPEPKSADEIELKRWHPQPETAPPAQTAEDKAFAEQEAKTPTTAPATRVDDEHDAPHAKTADSPLEPDVKHDHLADNTDEATVKPKKRQEALIDEGLEETFPASDPVSVKHIS